MLKYSGNMLARIKKSFLIVLLLFLPFLFLGYPVSAESDSAKLERLAREIEEYTQKIKELQVKASTLSNQIAQFDAQIRLTELKISQTEEQILLLGGRIDQIEVSLSDLEEAFNTRAVESYKISRINNAAYLLFSTEDVNKTLAKTYYLQKIQEADNNLLEKLKNAKEVYKEQKGDLEELQEVLGVQKEELDSQKTAKNNLLSLTRNDEKKYQSLLSQARAEFEAIQAIIAGKGDESEIGHVNAGERIASIIQGPSCNSSGSHLHFIVARGGNTENPFNYLKPIDHQNCSGPGECSPGDPFNPSGSWDWPINAPVKFSQGYGSTWAVQNTWVGRIYQFHNGIDINNEGNSEVKAVRSGTLYRGSYTGANGCRLRYVRVKHDENDIETYYLHINY